ncbi:Hypothetical predicted protein [Octopus vulgaris]|uniref:Uncharacterized protein n=1 Tax=Octopus vulgaris TaxID=6645 RepID=A0AA36FBF4_OCTVU|nr:Hypothetical predicted protein [Octopus vulgaris]
MPNMLGLIVMIMIDDNDDDDDVDDADDGDNDDNDNNDNNDDINDDINNNNNNNNNVGYSNNYIFSQNAKTKVKKSVISLELINHQHTDYTCPHTSLPKSFKT